MNVILSFILLITPLLTFANNDYALDDTHNHDGSHPEGQENCGGNYMYPGNIARLGSHSFLILDEDGPEHLILDHRSGTPPHNYQFLLRVHVNSKEMETYRRLLKESKNSLPAVTTIYFDKTGKQIDRTFFCLHDLPKIFNANSSKKDSFDKLFPIRATWQKDVDFEGAFPIKKSITKDDPLIIERNDVEIMVFRYLPSYLEQSGFRAYLKAHPDFISKLGHAPQTHDESSTTANSHRSYVKEGAFESNGETCPANYYLKSVRPPKTRHAFLILAATGDSSLLATHLYDQAPQNFQTTIRFKVSSSEMKTIKARLTKGPLLFMPNNFFCMAEIRDELTKGLKLSGELYSGSNLNEFQLGEKIGTLAPIKAEVLVNRILQSLMNPQALARDVFGFVDVTSINSNIQVESRYASEWNFMGKKINGYQTSRCLLTLEAAKALDAVQKDVEKLGYSLLLFDCYRPQRAVNEFVSWVNAKTESPKKSFFYPDEERSQLINRGYINDRSGHSRGSTIDLTLVKTNSMLKSYVETYSDCRHPTNVLGQVDMGTSYDCFSEKAITDSTLISKDAQKNRALLKNAMAKQGFKNYAKEWWHYSLNDEPYKNTFFDFEVQ